MRSPRRGPAAPAATGTSVTPARVSTRRALSVTFSSSALPPTVVTRAQVDGVRAARGEQDGDGVVVAGVAVEQDGARGGHRRQPRHAGHTRGGLVRSHLTTRTSETERTDAPAPQRSRPEPAAGHGGDHADKLSQVRPVFHDEDERQSAADRSTYHSPLKSLFEPVPLPALAQAAQVKQRF